MIDVAEPLPEVDHTLRLFGEFGPLAFFAAGVFAFVTIIIVVQLRSQAAERYTQWFAAGTGTAASLLMLAFALHTVFDPFGISARYHTQQAEYQRVFEDIEAEFSQLYPGVVYALRTEDGYQEAGTETLIEMIGASPANPVTQEINEEQVDEIAVYDADGQLHTEVSLVRGPTEEEDISHRAWLEIPD